MSRPYVREGPSYYSARAPEAFAEKQQAAEAAREAARAHLRQTGGGMGRGGVAGSFVPAAAVSDNTLKLVGAKMLAAAQQAERAAPAAAPRPSQRATAPADAGLPDGWASAVDAAGRTYYHHVTGSTQWERPAGGSGGGEGGAAPVPVGTAGHAVPPSASEGHPLPPGWFAASSADGTYYYTADGRTSWDVPTGGTEGDGGGLGGAGPSAAAAVAPARAAGGGGGPRGWEASTGAATHPLSGPPVRAAAIGPAPPPRAVAPFAQRTVHVHAPSHRPRGGFGGGGGGGGRGSAIDPLDPTGTGGKWSDGLEEASGRKQAASKAAAAAAASASGGAPAAAGAAGASGSKRPAGPSGEAGGAPPDGDSDELEAPTAAGRNVRQKTS